MPPKAKVAAPIDRPLSRAYLREFSGWSTAYPPGLSEPTSLRQMENMAINRDGSLRVRPGLRYLSYDVAPSAGVGAPPPLEGLRLRGAVSYNGQATAALPAGTQVGDLIVVVSTGGNWSGGQHKPYFTTGHGPQPDPRLTGYYLHDGGEMFWGHAEDLVPLTVPSFDQGAYGDTGYTRAGGVYPGTCRTTVAAFYDLSGHPLTATETYSGQRSNIAGNVAEPLVVPASGGPVVQLKFEAWGYGRVDMTPPGTLAAGGGVYYAQSPADYPGFTWSEASTSQLYNNAITSLHVHAKPLPTVVASPGVACDRPLVGTHEPFYLADGTKAYLLAVRELDETVGFRVLVVDVNDSTMYELDDPFIDFDVRQPRSVLNFSAETTYVKYLQIDNKIFALSDNGEPMRVFKVGAHKEAKALAEITRPSWDAEDKLEVVHPDAAWITSRELLGTRRNRIHNPSFEANGRLWKVGAATDKDRPRTPAVTPISGDRALRLESLPERTNLATAPLHDVATTDVVGWGAATGEPGVVADGTWLKVEMPAEKGEFYAHGARYPGVKGGTRYQVAFDHEEGAHVAMRCRVKFYGVNGAQVGKTVVHELSGAGRFSSPAMTAPKGAVSARVAVGGENTAAGTTFVRVKKVVVCAAAEGTAMFHGGSGANYFWTGTVNASASVYHPPAEITLTSDMTIAKPGKALVGSLYVAAQTTPRNATLKLQTFNKDREFLDSTPVTTAETVGTLTRMEVGDTAIPVKATRARLRLEIPAVPRGEYHWVDAAMIETGVSVAGAYFDGSTTDTGTHQHSWRGGKHESVSIEKEYAAAAAIPDSETRTADTLRATGGKAANPYSFGFFYTFNNEVGESAASRVTVKRAQRAWSEWIWETPNALGEPSGTSTNDPEKCADQLVAFMPQEVFDEAMAEGATSWSLYMFTWSDQDPAPVVALKVAQRELLPDAPYAENGWARVTPQQSGITEDAALPSEANRENYSDPSRAGQGLVAADRLVLVNDPTSAAVVRWSSNAVGEYTNFTASKGGGYKTLTSGNLYVPAVVKLWQNPQSVDTLCILCLGTDGQSAAYYMAPGQVTSQSDATSFMAFEETTATQGTTSPYGCEVFNNALYHPLDDQLVKSTASNYNINHKSLTDMIENVWSDLATKYWIISSQHDNRLYYLVNNPAGAELEDGCKGNEVWVYDAAQDSGTWSRFLIQAHSLRKIEFGNRIYMSVIRPDGVYYLDPEYALDDYVGAELLVGARTIDWRFETNTQGANRAHDAWAHLQQVSLVLGNFTGAAKFGIRSFDVHGRPVDRSKIVQDKNPPTEDGLPWDLTDYLLVQRDLMEWTLYGESLPDQPSSGQLNLVQYRYTPVSVNVGYEYGSVETFEYARNVAAGNNAISTNGVPVPAIDTRRP